LVSIGLVLSEEKIFEKVYDVRRTPSDGNSSFKIVSGDAVQQPTWPLLLKIEHMVKLQVLGNNSKTVNNIKNLTWDKRASLVSIGLVLSEEKIFEKVYDVRRTPSDGNSSHDPLILGQVS
jgi:hypothetical protein